MPKETSVRADALPYTCSTAITGLARLLHLYEHTPDAVTLDDLCDALEAALHHTPGQDIDEALYVQARVLDLAFGYLVAESAKNSTDEQTDMSLDLTKLHAGFHAQRQFRKTYAALTKKNETTNKLIRED